MFSDSLLSFLKTTVLKDLRSKLHICITLWSVIGKLLYPSGGVMFPWFFMFLEVFHCSLTFQYPASPLVFTDWFGGEIPSVSPTRDPEAFSESFYGYPGSTHLVPTWGHSWGDCVQLLSQPLPDPSPVMLQHSHFWVRWEAMGLSSSISYSGRIQGLIHKLSLFPSGRNHWPRRSWHSASHLEGGWHE